MGCALLPARPVSGFAGCKGQSSCTVLPVVLLLLHSLHDRLLVLTLHLLGLADRKLLAGRL